MVLLYVTYHFLIPLISFRVHLCSIISIQFFENEKKSIQIGFFGFAPVIAVIRFLIASLLNLEKLIKMLCASDFLLPMTNLSWFQSFLPGTKYTFRPQKTAANKILVFFK